MSLAPAVNASADKQRLGKITKQGNVVLLVHLSTFSRWYVGKAIRALCLAEVLAAAAERLGLLK